jgi:hypothetical protein
VLLTKKYLVRSTDHEAPHYAVFYIPYPIIITAIHLTKFIIITARKQDFSYII